MSLPDQLMVVTFSVLTSVGAAEVPSASLPNIVAVLTHFGIPWEALTLVLGVERVLDMGRTVVNVTGDVTAACYVSASEGHPLKFQVRRRSASTSATAAS
jgi:DAACS family dicarboxylate/amino acid:cation (Na+ or H+) symporter